ncbi:MAG TPA: helix-turn-helix transcriptional regulator [Candidatus Binataceae bacterium]|nr:helix-turn-helix transcriptional regulator [Candidatus Binataceae bacterium]
MGSLIRARRLALQLTQRELAVMLKVKPAHVAYLELDRRRPSLTLLGRIADVLSLERESLILLSHPEARDFVPLRDATPPAIARDDAWKQFSSNKALLARHKVSKAELSILAQVALLGRIDAPRSFLFILNSIRQAVLDDDL